MKQLKLPHHVFWEDSGEARVNADAAIVVTAEAHENRKKVILCGLFVEREVEAIIGYYLYPGPGVTEQQEFVAGEILGSNALTFEHKKRLIVSLVNKNGWLEGEAKSAFDGELKKVISYRNAFTHGTIVVRHPTPVLEYFEGNRQKRPLTDDYLSQIEDSFNAVIRRIEVIKEAAGMPRPKRDG